MKKFFTLILLILLGYGLYTVFDRTQILKKVECLGIGKTPVSSNEIGKITEDPWVVCAEPTTDALKECYDSSECIGACIIDKSSEGYEHSGDFIDKYGSNKTGYCQPYEEMDCFVERDRGLIILRKCPSN